ncbi:unnamed protein product [Leptidea sinapis]|uniref:Uncharacterized protein n=1 Tax=Leptidea sinapis TaxID=189913 RepID=A0A5E4QVY9_9NEOP|nr:unnamed protein product [Leptidea sinapis]
MINGTVTMDLKILTIYVMKSITTELRSQTKLQIVILLGDSNRVAVVFRFWITLMNHLKLNLSYVILIMNAKLTRFLKSFKIG